MLLYLEETILYEKGLGIEKDIQMAKEWSTKALNTGNSDAKERLNLMKGLEE